MQSHCISDQVQSACIVFISSFCITDTHYQVITLELTLMILLIQAHVNGDPIYGGADGGVVGGGSGCGNACQEVAQETQGSDRPQLLT